MVCWLCNSHFLYSNFLAMLLEILSPYSGIYSSPIKKFNHHRTFREIKRNNSEITDIGIKHWVTKPLVTVHLRIHWEQFHRMKQWLLPFVAPYYSQHSGYLQLPASSSFVLQSMRRASFPRPSLKRDRETVYGRSFEREWKEQFDS